jgi:hypothetical protein
MVALTTCQFLPRAVSFKVGVVTLKWGRQNKIQINSTEYFMGQETKVLEKKSF